MKCDYATFMLYILNILPTLNTVMFFNDTLRIKQNRLQIKLKINNADYKLHQLCVILK